MNNNATIRVESYVFTFTKVEKGFIFNDLIKRYNNFKDALCVYLKDENISTNIKNTIEKSLDSNNADILSFSKDDFEFIIEECYEDGDYIQIYSFVKACFSIEVFDCDCDDFSNMHKHCKSIEVHSTDDSVVVDEIEYDDYTVDEYFEYVDSNTFYEYEDLNSAFIKDSLYVF